MIIETNLDSIARHALSRVEENERFREWIDNCKAEQIDNAVMELNAEVSARVDCQACGNCCKKLMISILPEERPFFGEHFNMDQQFAAETYLSESPGGNSIMNSMPCIFLKKDSCTVYENRFTDCRQFPHLDKPGFTKRLWSTLHHYAICPIIFNVVEELKTEVGFQPEVIAPTPLTPRGFNIINT